MRLIVDTNIFIKREDISIIPDNLQELMRILSNVSAEMFIHPLSLEDIEQDKDESRKNIIRSKIGAYNLLESPPKPEHDKIFVEVIGQANNRNDYVDDNILYCLYRNAVDFLLTEDKTIHRKAAALGLSDRVFNTEDALLFFKEQYPNEKIISVPALKQVPVHNIDFQEHILDMLKRDYGEDEFKKWWDKISKQGRRAWIYPIASGIGAILIYKIEDETVESNPPLERKKRLKICTLVVSRTGYKIGELFIKMSVEYAIRNGIYEIYLTHFTEKDDRLITLIEDFGFLKVATKGKEDVFLKRLIPETGKKYPNKDIYRIFYPSFYDGGEVSKFVIPIRPEFHAKLFTDYARQSSLPEHMGEMITEGNTIKKAYLCNSNIKRINNRDILLFYKSVDSIITSLGIVESVHEGLTDPEAIRRIVGKRTVYSDREIRDMAAKPTTVIIFRHHFHLKNPVSLNNMLRQKILHGAPMSVVEIDHRAYIAIKVASGIDERFVINQTQIC